MSSRAEYNALDTDEIDEAESMIQQWRVSLYT